jgi:hypothetical protein
MAGRARLFSPGTSNLELFVPRSVNPSTECWRGHRRGLGSGDGTKNLGPRCWVRHLNIIRRPYETCARFEVFAGMRGRGDQKLVAAGGEDIGRLAS